VIAELGYLWNDANDDGRVEAGELDFDAGLKFSNGVDPDNPGSSIPVNRISKDYEPPTTDEYILGFERRISSDFSGSIAYTYRVVHHLEIVPLIGTSRVSYDYFGNAAGTAQSEDGFVLDFDVPYYGLDCPDPCVGALLRNRPDSRESYSGVELQLIKSLSHGWMARASFAYNDWKQRIGPAGVDDPNFDMQGSHPLVDGVINSTWQFNVSGSVELPFGIAAGMNLFGRQGFPTLYFVQVATHDSIDSRPEILIGKATRYRNPDVYELDLQLSKTLRIGSTVTVSPQIDCFNVFDSRTVLSRDGFVGIYDAETQSFEESPERFSAVGERLSHRVFRGGVRISF
jgi:hypothetical protein